MLHQEEEHGLPSVEDLAPDAQAQLKKEISLQKMSKTTRHGKYDLWKIRLKGQLPGKVKWYATKKVGGNFPHLNQ